MGGEDVEEISHRYRAPSKLMFGGVTLIVGFVLVTIIGLVDFFTEDGNRDINVKHFPSGHGYWPDTVSEMVHEFESPSGRIFYTFGMISGVCIFLSMYPFHLRNVYTGKAEVPCVGVYWTTFRQMVVPMGIMLLIGVNTYPQAVAMHSKGYTKMACKFVHLMGASMVFVGYMLCEFKCLGYFQLGRRDALQPQDEPELGPSERKVRTGLAYGILLFFLGFCILQVFLVLAKKYDTCCPDTWKFGGEIVEAELADTASGNYFWLKVMSFTFENVTGILTVLSHIAVWYFCEERFHHHGTYKLVELSLSSGGSRP